MCTRLAVAPGAGAELGHPGHLVLGLPDPAAHRLAADGLGDHDGVVGGAVHEVLGAVDRVDREGVLGGDVPVHQRVVGGEGLLTEHHGIRVGGDEPGGDDLLGLAVGDRDEVAGVLLHHLARRERAEARRDDLCGDLTQEVEDGVCRQARHEATVSQPGGGAKWVGRPPASKPADQPAWAPRPWVLSGHAAATGEPQDEGLDPQAGGQALQLRRLRRGAAAGAGGRADPLARHPAGVGERVDLPVRRTATSRRSAPTRPAAGSTSTTRSGGRSATS